MSKFLTKLFSLLLTLGLLCSLTVSAYAASSYSNETGKYDGCFVARVKNLTTKQVIDEKMPIEIEGMYVTVKFKDGDKCWKFSEILDRRYEKEIIVSPFGSKERFEIIFK